MTNSEWPFKAYLEPDALPFKASFSDASPSFIYGALYGILVMETISSGGCPFKTYFLAFYTYDIRYFLMKDKSNTKVIIFL